MARADERREVEGLELRQAVEGQRPWDVADSLREGLRMPVPLDPLPRYPQNGVSPLLRRRQGGLECLHEAVDAVALQPVGQRVPVGERLLAGRNAEVDGALQDEGSDPVRVVER